MLSARTLTRESADDSANIWRIFSGAPSYTRLVEGRMPSQADVVDFFDGMPPGKDASDKFSLGFHVDTDMVGCADVIRSYPANGDAFIGLLLFAEAHQGKGYGRHALRQIQEMAKNWGCSTLHLAVISTNPRALAFWQREGFEMLYRKTNPRFLGELVVMKRAIS